MMRWKGKAPWQNTCKLTDDVKRSLERFYCILGAMLCGMTGAQLCRSISHDLIVQMISHHRAAVEMAQNILIYIRDAALPRTSYRPKPKASPNCKGRWAAAVHSWIWTSMDGGWS